MERSRPNYYFLAPRTEGEKRETHGTSGNIRMQPPAPRQGFLQGAIKTAGQSGWFEGKRQRTAALQNLRYFAAHSNNAPASWSAAVLCRFRMAAIARHF